MNQERAIEILRPGPLCTVQDLGRPGWRRLGVGRSGPADRMSFRRANGLVGNDLGAAGLEVTLGQLDFQTIGPLRVGLAGAPVAVRRVSSDGDIVAVTAGDSTGQVVDLEPGDRLRLGSPHRGLRTYVSFAGGIDVPAVLGSRSTDVLAGLGPSPVAAGMRLPIGLLGDPIPADPTAAGSVVGDPVNAEPTLEIILGPRDDWFTGAAIATLGSQSWTVTMEANRVGIKLAGAMPLARARAGELPSEAMVAGSVQVPPSGQPVIFLADHPITGGYPVVGVLTDIAIAQAAQLRPGQTVRFAVQD